LTHRITLRKKGVFVEDQYDFEGHQFLGFWAIATHRASLLPIIPPNCLSWVDNGSFRTWREQNKLGGDSGCIQTSSRKILTLRSCSIAPLALSRRNKGCKSAGPFDLQANTFARVSLCLPLPDRSNSERSSFLASSGIDTVHSSI
jgi:hypothetical protein